MGRSASVPAYLAGLSDADAGTKITLSDPQNAGAGDRQRALKLPMPIVEDVFGLILDRHDAIPEANVVLAVSAL